MQWMRRARPVRWLITGVVLGSALTAAGAAVAASATITACANPSGVLRLSTDGTCSSNETTVTWNQTGPQGPAGPQGSVGPPGPQGIQGPPGPAAAAQTLSVTRRESQVFTFAPGETSLGTVVSCNAGEVAVSGGVRWINLAQQDRTKVHVYESGLADPDVTTGVSRWYTDVALESSATPGTQLVFFATCLRSS